MDPARNVADADPPSRPVAQHPQPPQPSMHGSQLVQIAVSWSFRMTRPNGHNGIVTCSAKISRCASTALISPAASRKLTGLAALESKRAAVWGRMTCDAPLSAITIGFMSLTVATCVGCHSEVSLSCPWIRYLSGSKKFHRLRILNNRTLEGLILGFYMGNSLRLDCQALPNALLPCWP